ncbi:MAG TPA: class I SAM-dependent methyltransferase [Gemmatimonadaceae bacterium]|nr:class I SAM-dependent methyltransferase [Gemmatimonadaceae bacterium]
MTDWDVRYAEPEYAYGTEPNTFVAAVACQIPDGPVLCLAEGQGRNAAYLATLGHAVTAVDRSAVGMARAGELAARRGVTVKCVVADLAEYDVTPGAWAGIVSVFMHLPPALRAHVYRKAVTGLRPGGVLVLEAYSPRQLNFGTGGPRVAELLVPRSALEDELAGLDFILVQDAEREVTEGAYHRGMAAVVQVLARKPEA